MSKNSYAEEYTEFLKYCQKKDNVSIDVLVQRFRQNQIENKFKRLYASGLYKRSSEYYKELRKEHKCS